MLRSIAGTFALALVSAALANAQVPNANDVREDGLCVGFGYAKGGDAYVRCRLEFQQERLENAQREIQTQQTQAQAQQTQDQPHELTWAERFHNANVGIAREMAAQADRRRARESHTTCYQLGNTVQCDTR